MKVRENETLFMKNWCEKNTPYQRKSPGDDRFCSTYRFDTVTSDGWSFLKSIKSGQSQGIDIK